MTRTYKELSTNVVEKQEKETKIMWDILRTTFSPRPCPPGPQFF